MLPALGDISGWQLFTSTHSNKPPSLALLPSHPRSPLQVVPHKQGVPGVLAEAGGLGCGPQNHQTARRRPGRALSTTSPPGGPRRGGGAGTHGAEAAVCPETVGPAPSPGEKAGGGRHGRSGACVSASSAPAALEGLERSRPVGAPGVPEFLER